MDYNMGLRIFIWIRRISWLFSIFCAIFIFRVFLEVAINGYPDIVVLLIVVPFLIEIFLSIVALFLKLLFSFSCFESKKMYLLKIQEGLKTAFSIVFLSYCVLFLGAWSYFAIQRKEFVSLLFLLPFLFFLIWFAIRKFMKK